MLNENSYNSDKSILPGTVFMYYPIYFSQQFHEVQRTTYRFDKKKKKIPFVIFTSH